MILSPIFLALGSLATSVLNARGRFAGVGDRADRLQPRDHRRGAGSSPPTSASRALAIGVVRGVARPSPRPAPAAPRHRLPLRPADRPGRSRRPARRSALMAPRALGLGATQITFIVLTVARLDDGHGQRSPPSTSRSPLLQIPIGLIGVPLGDRRAAVALARRGPRRTDRVRRAHLPGPPTARLRHAADRPASRIVLRDELVDAAVRPRPSSTSTDRPRRRRPSRAFLLGLTAHALIAVLARAFYARQDTRTPVAAAIVAVVVNTTLGIVLARAAGAARSGPRDRDRRLDRDDPAGRAPEAVAAGARPPAHRLARAAGRSIVAVGGVPGRRGRRGRPGPRPRLRPVAARARRPDDRGRCCLAPDIRRAVARSCGSRSSPRSSRSWSTSSAGRAGHDRDGRARRRRGGRARRGRRRPPEPDGRTMPPRTRPARRARMTPRGTRSSRAATRRPISS